MTLPATISVSFDFSQGATFGYPFTVGDAKYGVIGVSTFASTEVPDPVVDLSDVTRSIRITRGRNVMRDTYETGTCTVRVLDPNSYFNPQNVSSPYYGYLTPLRKIRVAATTATAQEFLFSGYVDSYKYYYPTGQEIGYVDIVCSDAFRLFQMANVAAVTDATAGQTTGTRITKILNQVSFPTSMRITDTGSTTVQADPGTSRTSLAALKAAEFAEQGAFFIRTDGTAEFKDRTDVVGSLAATPIEFNQTTGIPYSDLKYAFDDKLIINQASMTRVGGSAQTATDATSSAKYFPHGMTVTEMIPETDAQVLDIAKIYVATRAETTIRIDAMTVDLLDTAVPTNTMIGLDYFDNVKITNVQPDGSTIVKTLQVQGLAWDITPNSMKCTVTTLEPIVEGFIIGSSTYGIIGQSIMGYQENKMAVGFPAATGDIFTAADYNGLVAFTLNAQTGTTYTTVLNDQYQVLITQSNASANAIRIPTNASVAYAVGTVITVLNIGAGTCTISALTSGTTTVLSAGAVAASPTLAQYKSAACIKTATDTWYVVGAIG